MQTAGSRFRREQATFHDQSVGRRVTSELTAGADDAVAGDDEWKAVPRHRIAGRAGRRRRSAAPRQLSVRNCRSERNLATRRQRSLSRPAARRATSTWARTPRSSIAPSWGNVGVMCNGDPTRPVQ